MRRIIRLDLGTPSAPRRLARPLLLGGLVLLPLLIGTSGADETQSAEALSERLEQLERQLDASEFADRREASRQLRRLGEPAIPRLVEIARRGTAESRTRALDLLTEHYRGSRESLRAAAQAALEELAAGDGPAARHAQGVLQPTPVSAPPGAMNAAMRRAILLNNLRGQQRIPARALPGRAMPGRAVPGRVVPGLQPPGVPFPNLRIRAQMGQRRITMRSDANGIDVEVVESKEGREVTEKFRVKDAAELKQRHPEAHRLLEKFQAEQGVNQRAALEARAAQEAQAIDELRKRLGNENEMGKRRMLQQAIQLHERRLEALQQALPPMR